MFAKFNVLRRMLMSMIVPVFMFLRSTLLLEENLARQFLLPVDENIHFGRSDSAAIHSRNFQPRSDIQSCGSIFQELRRNSSVHQRAQKHVAADAGKAVEVSNAHKSQSLAVGPWSLVNPFEGNAPAKDFRANGQ
jgi:hypothetical protein